jgi:hypothetical protein
MAHIFLIYYEKGTFALSDKKSTPEKSKNKIMLQAVWLYIIFAKLCVGELTCPLYSFTTFKEHFHDKVFEIIP